MLKVSKWHYHEARIIFQKTSIQFQTVIFIHCNVVSDHKGREIDTLELIINY